MQQNIPLDAIEWTSLCTQVCATINDARFVQAGAWHLNYVRIDLPLSLAQAPQTAHQTLRDWFKQQTLPYLITGARRTNVLISLDFSKYR
jgi:hypothetical protein